jgi:hypothetical protein
MTARLIAGLVFFIVVAPAAVAQTAPLTFEVAAYVTCREAQAMPSEQRKGLAIFMAEHAARHRNVRIPDDERGAQLAYLVRGGCTLSPDAYLFTVIDRAIIAERTKFPTR